MTSFYCLKWSWFWLKWALKRYFYWNLWYLKIWLGNHVLPTCYYVRTSRYKINVYKITSFESIIFTARFIIFYVIQVVDVIMPTLTTQHQTFHGADTKFLPNKFLKSDFGRTDTNNANASNFKMQMLKIFNFKL